MYTEVLQDSMLGLLEEGRLTGASTTALTLSDEAMERVFDNMDFFAPRVVLRPQELSNNPGVVRRLGVIAINTALEADIYGNVNSTHVGGTHLMNGIGGSGDFVRNAYLSIMVCPSLAKGGKISTIVPMVTHVDHSEHSLQVLVTEQGLADLRGKGPLERAKAIIENCAHPSYRPYLNRYLEEAPMGHIRHDLDRCFELHRNLRERGTMLPDGD
jgi:acetyl-CoA hydrolase